MYVILLLEKKGRRLVGYAHVPACIIRTTVTKLEIKKRALLNLSLPVKQFINVFMREP